MIRNQTGVKTSEYGQVMCHNHRSQANLLHKVEVTQEIKQAKTQIINGVAITHIKGRLLDQAMILFKMGTSLNMLKGKNLLPEGAISFL